MKWKYDDYNTCIGKYKIYCIITSEIYLSSITKKLKNIIYLNPISKISNTNTQELKKVKCLKLTDFVSLLCRQHCCHTPFQGI